MYLNKIYCSCCCYNC